ncbi:MAG: class I SAM-dependent methyltransferase, partial [Acidobacteriota bacterium]
KAGGLISVDAATIEAGGNDRHKAAGTEVGWLVPDRLRKRWDLRIGFSSDVLPKLESVEKRLDIFMHDSLSVYDNMMYEYSQAVRLVKPGGLLISDDIETCSAFEEFAESRARKPFCFGTLGVVQI